MGALVDEWLEMQRILRVAYPWFVIGEPPSEETLSILHNCRAIIHNSGCFQEGICCEPENLKCAYRDKEKSRA